MQQRECTSIPRLSCQSNNVHPAPEENGGLALLQGTHGGSAIQIQIMPSNSGLCYAQHDNEQLEYDNNQEGESDSDDSNVCQRMNFLASDHNRNMAHPFSKGSLMQKRLFLNLKRAAANSGDSEAQKPSQSSTPDEDSSATDYGSSYIHADKTRSSKKLVCGLPIIVGVCILMVSLLTYGSMHQPLTDYHHDHKNTTSLESQGSIKEMKLSSADEELEGHSMIHFCRLSEEPNILEASSQCPAGEDPSIQQCAAKVFDDAFWAPFEEADESMCSIEGGVHHGPEAPFRDPAPGYEIPKYKERTNSSFFGSIHLLPMDKISLPPPLKKKRKKRSLQRTSTQGKREATVKISKPEPMQQMGSCCMRFSAALFHLLLLSCTALPVSAPLQEHQLLTHEANKLSDPANFTTCADYQVIETWSFVDVVIVGVILLLYAFRKTVKSHVVKIWPDCRRWLVDMITRLRCRSCSYIQKKLISVHSWLRASAMAIVIIVLKVARSAMKEIFRKVCSLFTISRLLSFAKLIYHRLRGRFRRRMHVQPAEYVAIPSHNNPQQPRTQLLPINTHPQPLMVSKHLRQGEEHPPQATCNNHATYCLDQHQVTVPSPRITGDFANSAQFRLEDASQIEIADDFSEHINQVSPSAADDDFGSLPSREHVDNDKVEPPPQYNSTSLPHIRHSGPEKEISQYATTSMGIHLAAEPCEPITCSDSSSNGELVCPTFMFQRRYRLTSRNRNREFVHPYQGAIVLNDQNNTFDENLVEQTAVAPQDVTAAIPLDSPNKLIMLNTAMNYDLKTLKCVRMDKESPPPPKRHPINVNYNMMHESLGHNATLYTLVLSEADREAIQLDDTPCLVLCRQ